MSDLRERLEKFAWDDLGPTAGSLLLLLWPVIEAAQKIEMWHYNYDEPTINLHKALRQLEKELNPRTFDDLTEAERKAPANPRGEK
jgi:hypothetical protein